MTKTSVGIFGAGGRMGREILKEITDFKTMELGAVIDRTLKQKLSDIKTLPDVFIDFSSPEGTMEIAKWCFTKKVPLVTGTTGFSSSQKKEITQWAKSTPVFMSPNMSLGINSMNEALKVFARNFSEGEVSLVETHHKHKKDKPSGTAKLLMDTLKGELSKKIIVSEPVSLRGGDVFGIHKVYFFGEGEWVCFEHQATGRSVFARGALTVALWLAEQKPGLYSMADYFAIKKKS